MTKTPTDKGDGPKRRKVRTPSFIKFSEGEPHLLYEVMRYPLASQVFALLCIYGDFGDGRFLGSYRLLAEHCTPPRGERGGRSLPAPTAKQVRTAVSWLEGTGLVVRGEHNKEHKQLLLWVRPRKSQPTSR